MTPIPGPELLELRRSALREFRWSSYPAYAGWCRSPKWLEPDVVLNGGAKAGLKGQRAAYRAYVESTLGQPLVESPLKRAMAGLLLGSADWIERMRGLLKGERLEQKAFRNLEKRPDWIAVRKAVEAVKNEPWARFANRHGDWGRDLALYLARHHTGMTLRAIGQQAGMASYYAVAQSIRRMPARLKRDRDLRTTAQKALKCMHVQT